MTSVAFLVIVAQNNCSSTVMSVACCRCTEVAPTSVISAAASPEPEMASADDGDAPVVEPRHAAHVAVPEDEHSAPAPDRPRPLSSPEHSPPESVVAPAEPAELSAMSPMTPLRPRAAARVRSAAVGPPVRLLLAGDSADLLIPVAAAEALGLGGRRGSFQVRLQLPPGSRVVTFSWFERPADGLRFLRAIGAQRRLRSDLSLPDGPHEVAVAAELGAATDLHVSLVASSLPAELSRGCATAHTSGDPADVECAAPSVDTAATLTETGAPQLSGRKRPRDGVRTVSDARSPPSADARQRLSTASQGQEVAAGEGDIALPAQQTVRITARQNSDGRSVCVPTLEARSAGLTGTSRDRVIDVPELGRKATLSVGWGADRFRLGKGWRELAEDMRLPADASVVLTVANNAICSVERAPAATAASNSSGMPGPSTANGGRALAAKGGGIAAPAQQSVRITVRQNGEGRSLYVPLREARGAGLSGNYCDRVVNVPELRRTVTLRLGWAANEFRVGRGWKELAQDMHLPMAARVVLTAVDGTICSVERADAAAAASGSSSLPGASTGNAGRALAAEGGSIAAPAQQIFRIAARQNGDGRSLAVPKLQALAAGLSGDYCDRVVAVPELRHNVTLRIGWAVGKFPKFRVGRGWRELAADMRLPVDACVVLTVADGTICSVERAHAAAAAGIGSSMPRASSGMICTANAVPSPPAALAQQGHESAKDADGESSAAGGQSSRLYPPIVSSPRHCTVSYCSMHGPATTG